MGFFDTVTTFDSVLQFGKYKGRTVIDIYEEDPEYLRWVMDETDMLSMSDEDEDKIRIAADEAESLGDTFFEDWWDGLCPDEFDD